MVLYRVLTTISRGEPGKDIPQGIISPLRDLRESAKMRLRERGVIVEVSAPPIAALPGLKGRAQALARVGILTADQLLEEDAAQIARKLRQPPDVVRAWQRDVEIALMPPEHRPAG